MTAAAPARRPGLWPLWALLAIFALPVVGAWFFYLHPEYLPAARSAARVSALRGRRGPSYGQPRQTPTGRTKTA